jgi:hypothetical protein
MTTTPTEALAAIGAVFAALYAAHMIGDHWGQTHHQALTKGKPGWVGRWADTKHVLALTALKVLAVLGLFAIAGTHLPVWATVAGLSVDAASHWWADRRTTLVWLADRVERAGINGKTAFHAIGAPRPGHDDNPSLGTGAYALDQSFHIGWLFITALIIGAGL